ncbi:Grx4 family monothiol glutaredoxin [Buchnera aphidicola]|uniref:Grx4 family monothiol glutaredoxin n=1 Tax=Buchnera aphidicola TaxID=9 RepID=UPI0034638E36
MKIISKIQDQINKNPILLYMKGSPEFPSCGFSAKAVKILSSLKVRFAYIDVIQNPDIRRELPIFSNWPTFPQLWISGELIGGSDIMEDLFHRGKLKKIIKKCLLKKNEILK